MNPIKIVTDSTVQLSKEEQEKYNITVVPLAAMLDHSLYYDDITVSKAEFLHLMEKSPVLPKTSQPSIGQMAETYNRLGSNGSEVLSIHVAGYLTGTCSAAQQGAMLSSSKVTIFDSQFVDRPLAYQVIRAAELAQQRASIEEIKQELELIKWNTKMYIGIVNLDNLIKGGRMNQTLGRISTFLNIKLMLNFTPEALIPEVKGRGLKALQKKVESIIMEMKSSADIKQIGFTHIGLNPFSEKIIRSLKENFPGVPMHIGYACPTLMAHAGKEAFAISYLKK